MAQITHEVAHNPEALLMVFDSILVDLTALKTAVDAVVTKLNSDGGVSDTDYSAVATLTTT